MEEFDYRNFLVENKLTINSRLLNEEAKTLSPERKKELKDFQTNVEESLKSLSQVLNTGSSGNYNYPTILFSIKDRVEKLMTSIKDEFGEP
jgi:hypothetical protein